jgi:hypothetical protein
MQPSRFVVASFGALLILTLADVALAQSLSRGPYLQNTNTSAVTIRWRTSSNADSVVRYGLSEGNLGTVVSSPTLRTEHELRITGLAPNMKYYYSIGTSSVTFASGADYFFVTAPSSAKPTRVWVLGDAGTGSSSQIAVRDAYYTYTGARGTDLWLTLGDNAYQNGTDGEYQSRMYDVYGSVLRNAPLYPTLGNHDGRSASSATQTGPYYDMFTLPKSAEAGGVASNTEAYYSFDYGNIHFVCLNSYDVSRAVNGPMLTWLASDLAANTKDWLIVFFHHPPYSKGGHNSDTESYMIDMRQNALPILESYGVDLVLTGHSHSYERSMLIDGHYGLSGTFGPSMILDDGDGQEGGSGPYLKSAAGPVVHEGAVYAVAGASGQITGGALNHPAMYTSLNVLGSMVLDVDGPRLDAAYLDSTGVVRDTFTIIKDGSINRPPSATITSPTSGTSFTEPANVAIEATATDSDGTVARVDFYAGALLLGSDDSSPYTFSWTSVAAGSYDLTAVAIDDDGASGTPNVVPITVASPSVTVTFQQGASGYTGMIDSTLRSGAATTNYGSSTSLRIDGSPDECAVMRWDLSSIPAGKTVTQVQMTVRISDGTTGSYELYALKRAFSEAQTTWQRATSMVNWQTSGANGSNDRETTVLGALTGSAGTTLTITLNAAGLAKVQAWINDPASNFGFVLLDYGVIDGLYLRSSEYGTVSQRPRLSVTYQ